MEEWRGGACSIHIGNTNNIVMGTSDSNVRHPRCVLYNSKELGMLTLTVEHNYICFITRSLQQRYVSALYVCHHQVVIRLRA